VNVAAHCAQHIQRLQVFGFLKVTTPHQYISNDNDVLCSSAEQIQNGEVAAAPNANMTTAMEEEEPTALAQHIKGQQKGLSSKTNAQLDKHQAALLREQAAAGGGLGSLLGSIGGTHGSSQRSGKRPVRLGRLL
jgi:hypothetical protein